jgi:opacity protein-like surface antigen
MPLNFRVGVAMDVIEGNMNRLTVAVDAKQLSDNSSSLDVGAEYGFKNMLFFRGGYRSLFTKVVEDGGFTAGFGLNYDLNSRNSIRVGYSFQHHQRLNNPQIWTLGVTF